MCIRDSYRLKKKELIDFVHFSCSTYKKYGVNACSSHRIEARDLYNIVLEDIQWMDEVSVRLLTSVMLRMEKRAMFLFTARPEMSQALEDALATLTGYGLVETIALERFDREQSFAFIKEALKKPISSTIMEKIYHETEGNPFFLTEFVQLLTTSETRCV